MEKVFGAKSVDKSNCRLNKLAKSEGVNVGAMNLMCVSGLAS